jgi:hypothetical protein
VGAERDRKTDGEGRPDAEDELLRARPNLPGPADLAPSARSMWWVQMQARRTAHTPLKTSVTTVTVLPRPLPGGDLLSRQTVSA